MLLLDEGAHSHGLGLASRLRQRRAAFFRGLLPAARGGHADIGQERVAFLAFRLHEDNVRSFPGPYQVMFRSHIGEFLTDLLNEMAVKISPQPASLDVGIHAWKRRLHDLLLQALISRASTICGRSLSLMTTAPPGPLFPGAVPKKA